MAAEETPDGVGYASVVPAEDERWRDLVENGLGLRFHRVGWRDLSRGPVTLDYPDPDTIGADRLCDAAAAVSRHGAPVLVMDFGTCLTAAFIGPDRVWRGGVIAPGYPALRDYLPGRAAKLPRMEEPASGVALPRYGRSTMEAMQLGVRLGCRGMVREIAASLLEGFDGECARVATGGYARTALEGSGLGFTIDPDLTLAGIGLLFPKDEEKE